MMINASGPMFFCKVSSLVSVMAAVRVSSITSQVGGFVQSRRHFPAAGYSGLARRGAFVFGFVNDSSSLVTRLTSSSINSDMISPIFGLREVIVLDIDSANRLGITAMLFLPVGDL